MKFKTVNISLPAALLERADAQAKLNYAPRSEYIRRALLRQVASDEANSSPEALISCKETHRLKAARLIAKEIKEAEADGGLTEIY